MVYRFGVGPLEAPCRIDRHLPTSQDLFARRYFFAPGCQFISGVIGAANESAVLTLTKKRPLGATSNCYR